MTERLDEQVCHSVVQVARVNDHTYTQGDRDTQHDSLVVGNGCVPTAAGGGGRELAVLVVSSKA